MRLVTYLVKTQRKIMFSTRDIEIVRANLF